MMKQIICIEQAMYLRSAHEVFRHSPLPVLRGRGIPKHRFGGSGHNLRSTIIIALFFLLLGFVSVRAETPGRPEKSGSDLCFAYRSFWPEFEAMKQFKENLDCDTICIFPGNTVNSLGEPYCKYPCHWVWYDKYRFEYLDQQFDDILAVNPDAKFLCMIDVNPPLWLSRKLGMRGYGGADSFTDLSNCVTDPEWRKQVLGYVEAFVTHVEKKYAKNIRAYIPAGGQTSEWIDHARGRMSRPKSKAFLEWAEKHGKRKPPSVIPFERFDAPAFENVLYDPATQWDIVDYQQFNGDAIVDAIQEIVRKIRSLVPKEREIGVFFAQVVDSGSPTIGHLEYERLFADPGIDFFISPGSYRDRPMGGGSGIRMPHGTLQRYGKTYLHEADHRTYSTNSFVSGNVDMSFSNIHAAKWKDAAEVDAGLKRETALALINHSSIWWFDMWGGFYRPEATQETLKVIKKVWDQWTPDRSPSVAEVALVIDPQSRRYLGGSFGKFVPEYFFTQMKLNRLGAPFDIFSFSDTGKVDLSRYKFVIFHEPFVITPDREKLLREHILKDDRTVLWMFAPGVIDGETAKKERVEKWTGVAFGTPGASRVKRDGWNSVYVHQYKTLTPQLLREIAAESGVHFYVEQPLPVYANRRLLAVHTAEGGPQKVTLPKKCRKVVDVFAEKTVAENAAEFMYEFKKPDTVLFELQDF